MKVIKLPSFEHLKAYRGIKFEFDDSTSIFLSAVELMPILRFNYREDHNLAKYPINMLNEIRKAFNKPPHKYKTYEYFQNDVDS